MEEQTNNSALIEALKKQDEANKEVEQLKQQKEPNLPNSFAAQSMMSGKSSAFPSKTDKKETKKRKTKIILAGGSAYATMPRDKKPHPRKKGSFTTKRTMNKAEYNVKLEKK